MFPVNIFLNLLLITMVRLPESRAQMSSKDASEGACLEPTPKVPKGVDYGWLLAPGTPMFVPMGNQHMYRSYAEYLIGRSPTDEMELKFMFLKITYLGPFVKNSGFGESVGQFCTPFERLRPNVADMQCRSTVGSARANATLINFTHDTLIWTDNKSALLFVRCIHGERDFKVLSPFPTISEDVKLEILDQIKKLGFSEERVQYLPYYGL